MVRDFVEQGKKDMPDFIIKAIDDHLDILNSKVEFPCDKKGRVLYNKLFAIVQSRENVWMGTTELMDMAEIDRSSNKNYLKKIESGFETTWHEMTKIVCMSIGEHIPSMDQLPSEKELSEDEIRQLARESVTDDMLSSISKAKVLAAKLSYQILDRLELLRNPDKVNEAKMNNESSGSIIERYAKK